MSSSQDTDPEITKIGPLVTGTTLNNVMSKLLKAMQSQGIVKVSTDTAVQRMTSIEQSASRTLSNQCIANFNTYIDDVQHLNNVIGVCVNSVVSVVKGGALQVTDVANFVNVIQSIFSEVNRLNISSVTVSIQSNDLIKICSLILESCLAVIIPEDNVFQSVTVILGSAVSLISFSMNNTITCGLFSCCKKSKIFT